MARIECIMPASAALSTSTTHQQAEEGTASPSRLPVQRVTTGAWATANRPSQKVSAIHGARSTAGLGATSIPSLAGDAATPTTLSAKASHLRLTPPSPFRALSRSSTCAPSACRRLRRRRCALRASTSAAFSYLFFLVRGGGLRSCVRLASRSLSSFSWSVFSSLYSSCGRAVLSARLPCSLARLPVAFDDRDSLIAIHSLLSFFGGGASSASLGLS